MRRSLAALAASILLLSSVGDATGAEPEASSSPAPIIEPTPPAEPPPSVDPAPSADPTTDPSQATNPSASPSGDPTPQPGRRPDGPMMAPIVEAANGLGRDAAKPAPRAATDPTDRWIVMLKPGTDVTAAVERQGRRIGFTTDRTFRHAVRGFSTRLDRAQVTALSHDPSVAMIVPDEKIELEGQSTPTGISRVGATRSVIAKIDGVDERVDADVAIVDTGIKTVADLNVVGGYNCSTTNRAAWRDVYGHGTHVAGTVGAIDNGSGVVGVAPGVRLWAVKILNDSGEGLLSWYVCGLDWIAAQRDPNDSTRPLIEAVNMSVAKYGKDDATCGTTVHDILHAAICRLVQSGVTVVAAAGNDSGSAAKRVPAAYNQVITVSALADTDGKPGGLGGHRCYSWGSYDTDDTFANFSNYGSDVDLIAPGKCIWSTVPGGYQYMSGTSMAAPHVTGAVALLKASRPYLSWSEVREALRYLGTSAWKTWTDPDSVHEPLLDVSRIGSRGDFAIDAGSQAVVGESGGPAAVPITIARTPTSFERIRLSATDLPAGATATFSPTSLYGFTSAVATVTVAVPFGLAPGSYSFTIIASEHDNVHRTTASFRVTTEPPVAQPPNAAVQLKGTLGATSVPTLVSWPAGTDPGSGIAAYELETSVDGAAFGATVSTAGSVRTHATTETIGHAYAYRVRAQDGVGNWSNWATGPDATPSIVQDRSSTVSFSASWKRLLYSNASGGSTMYSSKTGAWARTTITGRGVALVAPLGTSRGSAKVYVDGVYRGTISTRSSVNRSRAIAWSMSFSAVGTHTIELRLSGNGRVDVDAFVILR
jgi:subtilisin